MKLFTSEQIREIDKYTIIHEPISSIKLIERVADSLYTAFKKHFNSPQKTAIIAGKGNNGSDAIALAIKLIGQGFDCTIYSYEKHLCKADIQYFLDKCNCLNISKVTEKELEQYALIIDGLLGTGLSKPIEGLELQVINAINSSHSKIISIDIPSGMNSDSIPENEQVIVKADYTFTLEFPKLSFMLPEHGQYLGKTEIISIGLHQTAIKQIGTPYYFIQKKAIFFKERQRFAHKGTFGHVLTIAGSYGKMGASILASKASMKIGAGLVTAYVPKAGLNIIQSAFPEAMAIADEEDEFISSYPIDEGYKSICIGPGLGQNNKTVDAFIRFLKHCSKPLIIDADALNCIALSQATDAIPKGSIITPHVKEFERLFGTFHNSSQRLQAQREFSIKLQIYIVLKGHHTSITTPDGDVFFNSTGNPGMATAGSGDVLSGIIAGLLAQGYSPKEAAIFGVFIHGKAGDLASETLTENCVLASDIIAFLPNAIVSLR